jgi:tetratricopeptide (TPR) repeat protein
MKTHFARISLLSAAFAAFAAYAAPAAEAPDALLGADELVSSIAGAMPTPDAPPTADPRDLIDEIAALRSDGAARRDPDLRAARWLELEERAEAIGLITPLDPTAERWNRDRALPLVVRHLVAALPPPSRWPAMREALDARAAAADPTNPPPALSALRLALARLSGDKAAVSKTLPALRRTPGAARGAEDKALRKAIHARDRVRRGGAGRIPGFSRLFRPDRDETPAEAFVKHLEEGYWSDGVPVADEELELPDETLAKILDSPTIPWMHGSDEVRARYRAIVRAAGTNAPAAAVAWSFADLTPDGQAYFAERAAARNAPGAWEDEFARLAARGPDVLLSDRVAMQASEPAAYLRAVATLCGGDLAEGRIAEADARLDAALPEPIRPAVALAALEGAYEGFDPYDRASRRPPVASAALGDFVERRLLPPAASATEKAVALLLRATPMADAGSAAHLAELAERLKADPDTDPRVLDTLERGRLASVLASALAAARFDDATAAARRLAKRPPVKRPRDDEDDDREDEVPELLLTYARAMLAAGETNRFDEAIALVRRTAASRGNDASLRAAAENMLVQAGVAKLLARAGRSAEAQAFYMEDLLQTVRRLGAKGELPVRTRYSYTGTLNRDLEALAELYLDAGRPADALALFERLPLWGVADADGLGRNAQRLLARALDAAGRADDAVRVALHAVEISAYGYRSDWPWELLLERLPSEEYLALADRMHALVPWEERPVQWKAEALRRAGRLDEAEEAARLALQIDPTDGEAPAGDRIRSYSIFASILEEKGGEEAAKEAATLRSVVAAVRLAEKGDELSEAGLVSLALEAYDGAAALFEDAYCVQWRLAERLRERGFPELAAEHYEETFRRMPEQFGRVASLCFGCTGVFESGESVSAAERILPELAARPGALPATHRLLGMLRLEQKRYTEAWDAFRAALAADPGYLDALADLLALRGKVDRPRADWADLQRLAFELDPLGLRLCIEPEDILDWTAVREANAAARARLPVAPASVLPLPASASALAAAPAPRRDAWTYRQLDWICDKTTLADRAFDAALAYAEMDDPPTWLDALCRWLEASGNP